MVGSISLRLITYVAAKINIISESSKTISLKMSCTCSQTTLIHPTSPQLSTKELIFNILFPQEPTERFLIKLRIMTARRYTPHIDHTIHGMRVQQVEKLVLSMIRMSYRI